MQYKIPKNSEKYHWTNHAVRKMRYYGLSENRVIRVVRFHKRKEEGVAPETVAVMSPYGRSPEGRQPYRGEIWVMYQQKLKNQKEKIKINNNEKIIIISAWRYPGISPAGKKIPIPEEIRAELENILQDI